MNTVKRWLAGLLSFAMIFTSAGFSTVGSISVFAAANAAVVTNTDGKASYSTLAEALEKTIYYYGLFNQMLDEPVVITLNEDATLTENYPMIIPCIINLNGHTITGIDKLKEFDGNEYIDKTCKKIRYTDTGVVDTISFDYHGSSQKVYNWVYDASKKTPWYVKSVSTVCDNCGVLDTKDATGTTIYNPDENQYEYYDQNGNLKSTWAADVDPVGWVLTGGPYMVKTNEFIQHDSKGYPIVRALLTKVNTGESKVVDVAVTPLDSVKDKAEINNVIIKQINGIKKGNEAATCESGGAIIYRAVVSDPNGKVLNTTYFRDDQATEKLEHVKGALTGYQFAVEDGTAYATSASATKAAKNALDDDYSEKFIEVKKASDKKYHYWSWGATTRVAGTKLANVEKDMDVPVNAFNEDGSFVYRFVYECDIATTTTHPDLYGDSVTVKPNADAKNRAEAEAGILSTCEEWKYAKQVTEYEFTKDGKKVKYSFTGKIASRHKNEKYYSHNVDANSGYTVTKYKTCQTDGEAEVTCSICGKTNVKKATGKLNHEFITFPSGPITAAMLSGDPHDNRQPVVNAERTEAEVKADCTHPGGVYGWCKFVYESGYTGPKDAHAAIIRGEVKAKGHTLMTTVTGGSWKAYEFTASGYTKEITGPTAFAFDAENDYTFTTTRYCANGCGLSETVTYHYAEGVDTDTDIYSAIKVDQQVIGADCQTTAKTIYTVKDLTYPDGKAVTKEYDEKKTPGAHKYKVESWNWSKDFETATISGDCTVEGCNDKAAHPGTDIATVTQVTGTDGITTYTATYGTETDTRKAYSLKDAIVTFDASNVKNADLVAGIKGDPFAAPGEDAPAVTVIKNGTVIDSNLYVVEWDSYPVYKSNVASTARILTATVKWADSVKESDIPHTKDTAENYAYTTAGKEFTKISTRIAENGEKFGKETDVLDFERDYNPEKSYSVVTTTKENATVKYAIVNEEIKARKSEQEKDPWVVEKKIQALDYSLDTVEGLKNAGKYYVYAQFSKEGYTTVYSHVATIIINKKEVGAYVDNKVFIQGTTPNLALRAFEVGDESKEVVIDPAEYTFKTPGGQTLEKLTPGEYKLLIVSDNYEFSYPKYNDYLCTIKVISMDDATPEDIAKAEAISAEFDALTDASTEEEVAALRAKYDKLSDTAKALVSSESLKKLTDLEAKFAAQKKAEADKKAATDAANSAIAAANAYASDATIKALIDALNAALKKGDTAAIKKATADLNNAVAKKKATPAPTTKKKASKVKIKTKSKKIKASTIKKKAKKFKVKYSKTGNGKVTFKKVSGSKKLKISKAGKITIKKGTKKGTYKIKVKATIAATSTYKKATATKTIKVKVTK